MSEEETCPVCGGEGTYYDEDAGTDLECPYCVTEDDE